MKEPHSKGDSLPKPEPRPLWGSEEAGTGSAWQGGSRPGAEGGGERAVLFASDVPLFGAEVLCPQAKLNWRMFFMSKQDVGSHPLSVRWTTTTTTATTTHLRAGWPHSTTCCTKAPEELCRGIIRRNKSIIADLFNKPSVPFRHWPVNVSRALVSYRQESCKYVRGQKSGHLVTPGLYTGGPRTWVLCTQGAPLVLA